MACYGIVKSLLQLGVEIDLVMPSKLTAYFPLRKPEDADNMPVVLLDEAEINDGQESIPTIQTGDKKTASPHSPNQKHISINQLSIQERFDYLGLTGSPESYINLSDLTAFRSHLSSFFSIHPSFRSLLPSLLFKSIPGQSQENQDAEDYSLIDLLDSARQLLDKKNITGQNSENGEADAGSEEEDIFRKVQEYTIKAAKIAQHNEGYDLIHAHDWLTYPAGMLIKHNLQIPLISHIHATEFDRAGGTGNERVHKIEHSGMSFADLVIAVSKYTAQMIINRYRIDTSKIRIVHNAHTAKTVDKEPPESSKRIFRGTTILFLGRITIQKGPDYFLDAAKIVLEKHPDVHFIMAGTGDMARKLLHKSAAYRLKNRFLFAGFLNRREVEIILSNSDIYLLPSVSEPFGIAPLEAMAYGVTAIISKQSGVSEIVENAYKIDFWDTVKMAETINYLIENRQVCKEIGRKGMEEVEKIRWDSAASSIKQAYEQIILSKVSYE